MLAGVAGPAAYAVQTSSTPHQGSIPLAGPSTGGDAGPGMRDGRAGSDGDGPGGPGNEQTGAGLADLLTSANTRWAAATVGSQEAASMMLSTGTAVMAIGGFTGGDPSPTLAQFQEYVANGDVHYFVSGGGMGDGMGGGPGGGGRNNEIATWVQEHYTAQTVDGRTVYDLTAPASS